MVGPQYHRPTAVVPNSYKEPPPAGWKEAQPNDGELRGKWWEIFQDPQLNVLEERISISNQNILAAEAQFRAAKDAVRIARSALFPSVEIGASVVNSRTSSTLTNNQFTSFSPGLRTLYNLPLDFNYQVDLWGSIRRTVTANADIAQASAAELENARLLFQAELAQDYFQLRGTDAAQDLLERTVRSFEEYLQLTRSRLAVGVASGADVAQAETQLENARAQLIDLGVARTQLEHAIAVLTGKAPAELSISHSALQQVPPPVPVTIPSSLLERRPDIASAERQMAAANEQIGIAKAAFYPQLTLSASAGMETSHFLQWFNWPSRMWSLGPQASQFIFDGGRRRASLQQAEALYDSSVAAYRQTVLAGFQQVEDNLATLRVLENEARATHDAVQAAERALTISTAQYKAGTTAYLQVITAQTSALQNERTAVDILTRRTVATVLLVEALGGGWNASTLPTAKDVRSP
jgi:NodT family efflux transporter outer membrane factor (OMF) lipoprotein